MEKDQEQKNYHKNISSEEAQRNNDTKNENLSTNYLTITS